MKFEGIFVLNIMGWNDYAIANGVAYQLKMVWRGR